ncbi:MAG: N-6 DNA methylase, partial [Planctomycetota bacterium]|nr:N-6 DNA methylase [Planctomycetota bacterium]
DVDIHEPLDTVKLTELPDRYGPLAFLFPTNEEPVFKVDRLRVTREAADLLAACFSRLSAREDVGRETAQRFILQMLVALFSEDIGLLPKYFVTKLLKDCTDPPKAFDLLGGLFRAMATKDEARGGRFKEIAYFNGGLFAHPAPVELGADERARLLRAAEFDWSHISPDVFGTIFQHSMDAEERHALGAHYTTPADIMKIVTPTIVRPWRGAIERATTLRELAALRQRMFTFRVLDPACGSGNFLYIAYRELKRLEADLLARMDEVSTKKDKTQREFGFVTSKQFFGMDIIPFAVELAKVTMTLAHKLSIDELHVEESALPLDNLDANIVCVDGLIASEPAGLDGDDQKAWRTPLLDAEGKPVRTEWPRADVIIGNPPFNGAKKLKPDFGADYVNAVRKAYPKVPGMADYCVYWFARSEGHLPACSTADPFAGRAGLVGTQNIRNNKSRVGGLDPIAESGVIVEAVENQPWSGEANVHVSIANWVRLPAGATPESLTAEQMAGLDIPKVRRLWTKVDPRLALFDDAEGEGKTRKTTRVTGKRGKTRADKSFELRLREVGCINSALSDKTDVSGAVRLQCNTEPQRIFRGFEPGNMGFLLEPHEARLLLKKDPGSSPVIFPYLTGREMVSDGKPSRFLIDFQRLTMPEAQRYKGAFAHVQAHVLPQMEALESKRARASAGGQEFSDRARKRGLVARLDTWWHLRRCVSDTADMLRTLDRYIVCSLVTKRPIFVFQSSETLPSNLLQSFAFDDDYSFGILQSDTHWQWFVAKCSKLTERFRYTPRSVFDTFPWPQSPSKGQVRAVAEASREVRRLRDEILPTTTGGLRALYRSLELPGRHPLKDAHAALDAAVAAAYGFKKSAGGSDVLGRLLALNLEVAGAITQGEPVTPPGVPASFGDPAELVTDDCIRAG